MMAEPNPLCPDRGGHAPHTVLVTVRQGQAIMSNGKGHTRTGLLALNDGKYVTDCDGWQPEPLVIPLLDWDVS